MGVPEKEAKIISGINEQFDSKSIYHDLENELKEKGVIFCSIEEGYKKHRNIFKKYFSKLVSVNDNKYSALNSCV
jgi:Fe-S cluster assembly protein SufB